MNIPALISLPGLKLMNSASYPALDVNFDKAHFGHRAKYPYHPPLRPAGILLACDTTRDLHFVGMPPGIILLTPVSTKS